MVAMSREHFSTNTFVFPDPLAPKDRGDVRSLLDLEPQGRRAILLYSSISVL